MADVHNPKVRSYNMSMIKGKDTKPEIIVSKFLHSKGFRFRLHRKDLPGKPDIVLPKYSAVIFVNGCFWHGHKNCKYFVIPKTRTEWWKNKIDNNIKNDLKNKSGLKSAGWKIITIWTCQLKATKVNQTLHKTLSVLKKERLIIL